METNPASLSFYNPPPANWKITFGYESNFNIQFYIKKAPNRFQRWMIEKVLGIFWTKL